MHATGGNYGRWTFYNASTMLYEHVHNVGDGTDDNVTDSWIVTQVGLGRIVALQRRALTV